MIMTFFANILGMVCAWDVIICSYYVYVLHKFLFPLDTFLFLHLSGTYYGFSVSKNKWNITLEISKEKKKNIDDEEK
jgi:hypothetical protein